MRVRQHDRFDRVGADRQRLPVPLAQILQPLKQPAIDEHDAVRDVEQVLRSGDRARRAEKRQWRMHSLLLLRGPPHSARCGARRLALPPAAVRPTASLPQDQTSINRSACVPEEHVSSRESASRIIRSARPSPSPCTPGRAGFLRAARRQLQGLGRRRRRDAVAVADLAVVDVDVRSSAHADRLRAEPFGDAVDQPGDDVSDERRRRIVGADAEDSRATDRAARTRQSVPPACRRTTSRAR